MNTEKFSEAVSGVDDKYYAEAANYKPERSKRAWIKWGAVAACLCLVLYAAVKIIDIATPPEPPVVLPLLKSQFESDSMGFEGYMFYDISESGTANPWTKDSELKTLPVYKNLAYTDASGTPVFLDDNELISLAGEIAERFDIEITETAFDRVDASQLPQDTTLDGDEAYRFTAIAGEYTITVMGNGSASVEFNEPKALPDGYSFTEAMTSDEDAVKTVRYLSEDCADLIGFKQAAIYTWCEYTFSGNQTRCYYVFDKDDTILKQILNYNFCKVGFGQTINGGALQQINFENNLRSSEKIGDYPIINFNEARELLLNGKYITTVPGDYLNGGVITADSIAKIELIYRTGNINKIFMPYYRFYIALTDVSSNMTEGLTMYGTYYVPAISGEYLSDFPVWDGGFN